MSNIEARKITYHNIIKVFMHILFVCHRNAADLFQIGIVILLNEESVPTVQRDNVMVMPGDSNECCFSP